MYRLSTIIFLLSVSIACIDFASANCGPNSFYSDCGSICPITCENYNDPPKICADVCIRKCVCEQGYILNKEGKCVLPCEC
ncbi:chymotrypsin inhibitor-like [Vespa velutina]|uniref:chymotrypsin inhibitor-like n=1 Tax=Vespa velutina TaxID=202808 RepID=UPI001FB49E80|nr:chymotrypsin inhibitor-like [Vespa velutina]